MSIQTGSNAFSHRQAALCFMAAATTDCVASTAHRDIAHVQFAVGFAGNPRRLVPSAVRSVRDQCGSGRDN
jgi:hypothetical protein